MSDSTPDPHMMGSTGERASGESTDVFVSSPSASDLSEAVSDMSLSTSPGSDIPVCQTVSTAALSTSPGGQKLPQSSSEIPPSSRKRLVVRQLSSNPYLASSEMSPSDDHPIIIGSNSYAEGESRLFMNGDTSDENVSDFYKSKRAFSASSYPLTSDVIVDSDEENEVNDDENSNDDDSSDEKHCDAALCPHVSHDVSHESSNLVPDQPHQCDLEDHTCVNTNDVAPSVEGDQVLHAECAQSSPAKKQQQHNHHYYHQRHCHNHHHQQYQHRNNQQHQFGYHHSNQCHHQQQKLNNFSSPSVNSSVKHTSSSFNSLHNDNEALALGSVKVGMASSSTHSRKSKGRSDVTSQPQSREISSWGHFSKPTENHYKYRRSHYASDSDEDDGFNKRKNSAKHSGSRSTLKSYLSTCKCVNHRSPSHSPCMHKKNVVSSQSQNQAEKKSFTQNAVKPHVFKDRHQVMKRWFSECNDGQKNIILKGLLSVCELPQLHLLSVHMSKELHHGCPSNCEDILTWLPTDLATKVMSYLDPVSLCRAAQVCTVWRQLAEDQSLWRRFCCQAKWRLSKAAEHKQVISHMSPEGSIQWKNVFAERFRLRNNWLKGRCTVRTFEGHLQGISCVQFDDSRIVSGSSDKTIKVWNMRTNAPWSVQTLIGHHGTVRCLHLEGNRLVSGSSDTTIKVWDLSTQESWSSIACKVTMTGHTDTVRCLQADDDKVISGSYDKTLKIWDLKSGELRRTLRGHQAYVLCVHFSETKIVSGSADKTIKLWNYEGRCMMTLRGHQDAVTCLMFDSTRVVSGSLDHNLKFWDVHSGECLNTIDWKKAEGHTDVVRCLQADSWRVVSAADDKTIKVWNLVTGERLVTLRNHTDGVTCLQFNDFIIVSGSYDKSVKLWDFSSC